MGAKRWWQTRVAVLTTVALATTGVGLAPGAAADPGMPIQVHWSTPLPQFGTVLVAGSPTVTVTFVNDIGSDVTAEALVSFVDPSELQPGAPVADDLAAAGVDPATLVHEAAATDLVSNSCGEDGAPVTLAPGATCQMTVSLLAQGLGLQRPFGAALQLTDPTTVPPEGGAAGTVGRVLLVWPAPPANDDLVDSVDLSALDVPAYVAGLGGQPTDTVGVDVAVQHATWEPDELALMPGWEGNSDIQDAGSVWYSYTSTSFAGRLGYRLIDPTNQAMIRVAAYMSADPAAPPTAVTDLVAAPGNTWPPGNLSHVRMEPGHTVWFQVYAIAPLVGSTAAARLELFQAPNEQDDITDAYDGSFGGWGAQDVGGTGWGGDGDTYHVTADAGRGANLWFTTLVTATGHVRMLVSSEDMRARPSPRPLSLAVYRAPSTATVTDTSALGGPVTTLDSTLQTPNGADQAVVSFDGDLTPGRYYWSIERGQGDQPTWFAVGANYFPSTGGDTDPPETTITAGPTSPTRDADLVFEFAADEMGASFECAVDGGAFSACTSPFTITGAAEGQRTFAVRATDAAGNTDPTPAEATVVVDRTGPTVTITGAPAGTVAESSATLQVSSSELVGKGGFACTLSTGGTTADYPCDTPQAGDGDATTVALADLPDGEVTFCARAWDQAGNRSAQACATWTVAAPPAATITTPPDGTRYLQGQVPAAAVYSCTDNTGVASSELSVDGQPATSSTPLPTTVGAHAVALSCTDTAGLQATATATYTVEISEPLFIVDVQALDPGPVVSGGMVPFDVLIQKYLAAWDYSEPTVPVQLELGANTSMPPDDPRAVPEHCSIASTGVAPDGTPTARTLTCEVPSSLFSRYENNNWIYPFETWKMRLYLRVMGADQTSGTLSASAVDATDIDGTLIGTPACTVTGTDGPDTLIGTDGPDVLCGLGGDDVLRGLGGDDVLIGGPGNDRLEGGDRSDALIGGDGDDQLVGGNGHDMLVAGAGNDVLDGRAGGDVLDAGPGDDQLFGGPDADYMVAGSGRDRLSGDQVLGPNGPTNRLGGGADYLNGGDEDDSLLGGARGDVLVGGAGDDQLDGGGGWDVLNGGEGADTLAGGDGSDTLDGGPGDDRLDGGIGSAGGGDVLRGGEGADTLVGGPSSDSLDGGPGNDRLDGGGNDDTVTGGVGLDVIFGGSGNDTLDGGTGNDVVFGGDGDDTIIGGPGRDVLHGGYGADALRSAPDGNTLDWVSGGPGQDTGYADPVDVVAGVESVTRTGLNPPLP